MLLKINEAAKMLSVSVQTLRAWDSSGYLSAIKTEGNHRRYDIESLGKFMNGHREKPKVVLTSDMAKHIEKVRDKRIKEALSKLPVLENVGGFSNEDVALLLDNQLAFDDGSINEEDFKHAVKNLASPYLFKTYALDHPTTLFHYLRIREPHIVCESEDLVIRWHSEDHFDDFPPGTNQDRYLTIIKNIDSENITNILNNAGTVIENNKEQLFRTIERAKKEIDIKTKLKEPKWILCPPELLNYVTGKKVVKLTPYLSKVPDEEIYTSRLMPENQIAIGCKSTQSSYAGYVFAPYLLNATQKEGGCKGRKMIWSACKLLREGHKFYGRIDF